MNFSKIKLLLISLIAVAVLASCGGDPNIESAKLNLRNNDFDGVIASAQQALQENPENALAYYYIGIAYLGKSEQKPLTQQREDLENARINLDRASELFAAQGITSEEAALSRDLLVARWQNFYVDAVDPLDFEGENDPRQLQTSIDNLWNAVAVAPDTVMNYDALAEVYFLMEDLEKAISSMKTAIEMDPVADMFRFQRIVYFYSLAGDEEGTLAMLQDARKRFPTEAYFAQEVANIYLRRGDSDTAIAILMELIDIDPENAEYRLVIGSQIYREYLEMNREVNDKYDQIFALNDEFRDEARKARPNTRRIQEIENEIKALAAQILEINERQFAIAERAEEHLMISFELDPNNPNTTYILGAVNENRGLALLDQRNLTDDINRANELEAAAREHIAKALPYFERTAELEDDPDNWMKLFQIYTRLGMTEEAADAMNRAGL
jgi:tetratricopeptide (TPR) repeat protein